MFMFKKSLDMPAKGEALPGRPNPIPTASRISSTAIRSRGRIRQG